VLETDDKSLVALVRHHAEAHRIDPDAAVAFAATSRHRVDADSVAGFVTELAATKPYLTQPEPEPPAPESGELSPEEQAEAEKYREGAEIGRVIDQARVQAGMEPLFSQHYSDGDAA
jgi:hypothetical protein